jgi:hypothetical protein
MNSVSGESAEDLISGALRRAAEASPAKEAA